MTQSGTVSLEVQKCDLTDELGFKIKGTRHTDGMYIGTTGILVAHDIIEHVNGLKAIGSIGDELMALGGIWMVRGQWGDIVRGNYGTALSPQQHIAGELPQLYWLYNQGIPLRMGVGSDLPNLEDLYELWDEDIEPEALKMARGEWSDEDMFSLDTWETFMQSGRQLFVRGCVKLEEIWDENTLAANGQFWAIHDEIEEVLQWDVYEGKLYQLAYGAGSCSILPAEDC